VAQGIGQVQAPVSSKTRQNLKNPKKRVGGVPQVVERLPSKTEALSSNPTTTKKIKKNLVNTTYRPIITT
jgi:hypothetical protein